ncbi:AraC family transcriptional regulator [Streptomyces sp. NPDC051104]|uniref:AraC family transcriptional regulator n=1 Tax=Streptomyces sp. NPDC051104 TaxID=3155044 RepID=UPI00343D18E9
MSSDSSWLECLRQEEGGLDERLFAFASQNQIGEPIERTLVVICQCYGEKLSLSFLAKIAGLSNFHFCRVFQRQVGMSPIKFLAVVRMWRAKYLLESTTLSVAEITHQVGYGSVTTFTTRFSAMFGVAPGQLRRQHTRKLQQATGSAVVASQAEI